MKYINAADILPSELLQEIQKYVSGDVIYIPSKEQRKKWGVDSGARQFYMERNEEIRQLYFDGMDIEALSEKYALSVDTIRKIVFKG